MNSPVGNYHLQYLELEQALVRWVCEACEAFGEVRVKRAENWCGNDVIILPYLEMCLIT